MCWSPGSGEPWPGLTEDERKLMGSAGGRRIVAHLRRHPTHRARDHRALGVRDGRRHASTGRSRPRTRFVERAGVKVLAQPADYDRYCYIVAGTVGHMATELVTYRYGINGAAGDSLRAASEACGRALQKTNILKDFAEDLERGVCYLPDEWLQATGRTPLALAGASHDLQADRVRRSARRSSGGHGVRAESAVDGPRLSHGEPAVLAPCAAHQSACGAARATASSPPPTAYKISRATMGRCLLDAGRMVSDNAQILAYSRQVQEQIRG